MPGGIASGDRAGNRTVRDFKDRHNIAAFHHFFPRADKSADRRGRRRVRRDLDLDSARDARHDPVVNRRDAPRRLRRRADGKIAGDSRVANAPLLADLRKKPRILARADLQT